MRVVCTKLNRPMSGASNSKRQGAMNMSDVCPSLRLSPRLYTQSNSPRDSTGVASVCLGPGLTRVDRWIHRVNSGVAGPLAARGGGQICRPFVLGFGNRRACKSQCYSPGY